MTSPQHENAGQEVGLVGPKRKFSYTNRMMDWIALADPKVLPHFSVRLYWILKSFIIEDKGQEEPERVIRIVQEVLAKMMYCSVDTIQRGLKPLYALGLVEDLERRKVSVREPGQKKPTVTTILIMQVNEPEPPPGYQGWVRPFEARKEITAEREAAKAAKAAAKAAEQAAAAAAETPDVEPGVSAGQSDTADLRSQTDQGSEAVRDSGGVSAAQTDTAGLRPHSDQAESEERDASEDEVDAAAQQPVDNSAKIVDEHVSAGQCDTANQPDSGANLLGTGADLLQNGAGLRPYRSNPLGSNSSGSNSSGTGGRNAAPQTPASMITDSPSVVVSDQLELLGNAPHARAEQASGAREDDLDQATEQGTGFEHHGIGALLHELELTGQALVAETGKPLFDASRRMTLLRAECKRRKIRWELVEAAIYGHPDEPLTTADEDYALVGVEKVVTKSGKTRTARRRPRR
jgi:hypothetical protein